MNKTEIEKIALEVGDELPDMDGGSSSCIEFATRFLAAIDAERGKEAVAWVDTLDTARPRCITNLDYRSVTEAKLGVEYVPLFLSTPPTIPEGMAQRSAVAEECAMLCDALAAKAEDAARDGGYYSKEFASAYEFAAADIRANIAAAQGERK